MKIVLLTIVLVPLAICGNAQNCGVDICKCTVDPQHNIGTLDCSGLKINGIPKYKPLDGNSGTVISELDLSLNMIEKISDLAFFGMESLTNLNMQRNYLNEIGRYAFEDKKRNYTTNIASMDFEGNDFVNIPGVFSVLDSLPKMKTLSFKNNAIGPGISSNGFYALVNLETLNLERNKLSILSDNLFRHFVNLQTLRLGHNRFSFMSKTLFGHGNTLQYLLVQNNQLSSIPESLPTSLKYLDLAYNKIFGLGERDIAFLNTLRELRNLNFSGNNMQAILKESFANLRNLQVLDLSNNGFSYLSQEMFEGLGSLQGLLLQRNPFLSTIDSSTFTSMTSLNYLFLYQCSLQSLTFGTPSTSPYALTLDSYNGTEDFQTTEQSLPPLEMLWAYGNPFYCDCKLLPMLWFIKGRGVTIDPPFMYQSTVETLDLELIMVPESNFHIDSVCTAPHNRHFDVVDRVLTNIPELHLTCPDQPYYIIVSSCLGLALFIGVIPFLFFVIFLYLLLLQFLKEYCECLRPTGED